MKSGQNHRARHSERGKKTRQTEEEVGRQHQGTDRPRVRQVPEGSGEQGKWRQLVAKSSVVPQRPSRLRNRWWWWWWWWFFLCCQYKFKSEWLGTQSLNLNTPTWPSGLDVTSVSSIQQSSTWMQLIWTKTFLVQVCTKNIFALNNWFYITWYLRKNKIEKNGKGLNAY